MEKDQLSEEKQNAIEAFIRWMRQRRYADQTIKTYSGMLKVFFSHYPDKSIKDISVSIVEDFNYYYVIQKGFSASYQNQMINAIKLFYLKMMGMNMELKNLERPRKGHYLPTVLSKKEVGDILRLTRNIKHRAILSLIYSAGLRRNELINLRLADIDSKRMLIQIKNSKGAKDRLVGLSEKILTLLREYYTLYKPKYYLFEGQKGGKYTGTSINMIFQRAKKRAGVNKQGGVHMLRHSYATHLHESGYDIRIIQELLGHKSSKTTEIYTHISTRRIQNISSPFDDI
jgi:integrase/recombinase XerD